MEPKWPLLSLEHGDWNKPQNIYIPKSRVQRYQPSDPRPAYFRRLNIVSLEHRFSGCCLLAFGDPKATLHDLRNKMQSLLETTCSQKTFKKVSRKIHPTKSFSMTPYTEIPFCRTIATTCFFLVVGFYEVSIWRISLCAWDALLSPAALPDVGWKYSTNNIQQNHGKWNEWWERVTLETHKNLLVATQAFLEFSPRKLGRSSNLTSIFFRWVETTN